MFSSLGIVEILIIAGVALVVLGPDKFPQVAKVCIRMFREIRGYWEDAKRDISRELRPVNKEMRELQRYKPEDYIDSLVGDDEDEEDEDEDETGQDKADDAGDASSQHDYAEERDDYEDYEQYGLPGDDVYNQSGAKTDSAETEATTADDGPDSTEADEDSDSGPEESEPTATDDDTLPERLDG